MELSRWEKVITYLYWLKTFSKILIKLKVSYVTALLPYVIILILVIQGALLEGSGIGVEYYIANIDWSRLDDPNIWKDAVNLF